jgi:hypothetical protein
MLILFNMAYAGTIHNLIQHMPAQITTLYGIICRHDLRLDTACASPICNCQFAGAKIRNLLLRYAAMAIYRHEYMQIGPMLYSYGNLPA